MAADGRSVVFISHKLGEVMAIADRITVMRRGKVTAAGIAVADTSRTDLARRMVGREVLETLERQPFAPGEVLLSVRDLRADNDRGLRALADIPLAGREAEIVAIA